MPGISQVPADETVDRIRALAARGLSQFLLFGVTDPAKKDPSGSHAAMAEAPVNRVLSQVRHAGLDVVLYADLCLCEYTSHGHCGILDKPDGPWVVDNDRTLEQMATVAVAQAKAGADVVAPSAMMDGQVAAVRSALDAAGFTHVAILSYAIKYASSLYGPFREAAEGGMKFGDRRGYQMDYRRRREWRSELEADLDEGADMVIVKPAVACLDILQQVREACSVPVAAYHVSGEYAMLHAAARMGWLDLKATALEHSFAIRRAGADLIITYFAPQLLEWLEH
jgi:porphobilinogen synthase